MEINPDLKQMSSVETVKAIKDSKDEILALSNNIEKLKKLKEHLKQVGYKSV